MQEASDALSKTTDSDTVSTCHIKFWNQVFYQMLLVWILRLYVTPLFPSEMLSIEMSVREKIAHLKSPKEIASFLIVENVSLATTYHDVCAAYMMYMTVPVRDATTKRSFSKLKLIKNFLQGSMSQERLSGFALLSIENERGKNLDFRKAIQQLASAKARREISSFQLSQKFQVSNHPQINNGSLLNWLQLIVYY